MYQKPKRLIGLGTTLVVIALVVSGLVIPSISNVPINHMGVVFNRVEKGIKETPVDPGWRFHVPYVETVYDVPTYTQSLHLRPGTDKEGNPHDDTLVTQTRDGQWLKTQAEVQYRIMPENVVQIFRQFANPDRSLDLNIKQKMVPIVQRAVESVTSQYDIVDALGQKRGAMQKDLEEDIANELSEIGITLQSFTLIDTDAGDDIEAAIAKEAVEQQNIETAKQEQERARIHNQTAIEKEQAEAERKIIQAEAEAEANRKIADSITPELTDYLEAQARQVHGWIEVQGISNAIVDTSN